MRVTPIRALLALSFVLCVSSSHAHNKVAVIPLGGDDFSPAPVYAIGDIGPAGGIVFFVTNGGINGLEAAPIDQSTAPWNCVGTDVAGVDNIAVKETPDSNSGAANTPLIALACGGSAVSVAVVAAVYIWPNGQRDGFLPNKEELGLLYAQKDIVGGFANTVYWSSSEIDNNNAWTVPFNTGTPFPQFKGNIPKVRAVRTF